MRTVRGTAGFLHGQRKPSLLGKFMAYSCPTRSRGTWPPALNLVTSDLILVDLTLPGLSGLNSTRWLRGDHARRGTELVALTGVSGPTFAEARGAAGLTPLSPA